MQKLPAPHAITNPLYPTCMLTSLLSGLHE
jgi:hypothetical protein